MRVRVEGPASSKITPLVFIHGAGGAATVWLELFRHFERSRRVIAVDLPGHGQSDVWHQVPDQDRIDHYRDAIGVACAHLDVKRALIIGHSMGGLIALSAAAAFPDKVAGVVTFGAAPDMKPPPTLLAALAARPTHQAEILAELGWSPTTPTDTVARWFRTVTGAAPETTLRDLRAVAAFDFASLCEAVRARTLLIGGEDDLLCPPALIERGGRALPNAETCLLASAGHHVHLEQPAAAIEAINRFATFV